MAWHVSHDALEGQDLCSPFVPIVIPVGDDADGTWLVPLEPGDVLPILGEDAPALWRAARAAVGSWAWSDMILVTDDPADPELRAEATAEPYMARQVLFVGDPASLPPALATRCAVITMEAVAASDLTILVDHRAATLHPMGLVIRPHLQSAETAERLAELVAPPVESDPFLVTSTAPFTSTPLVTSTAQQDVNRPDNGTAALSPGTVDVRLLTMTPRLDGLRNDLPPNRARRAVELVAYLALHRPDVVTSDRLRTRVLGSSDADAASQTLFNIAYAAAPRPGRRRRGQSALSHGDS